MYTLGRKYLNVPCKCEICGGNMVYKGIGEYECEKCGDFKYDDYGKVRSYLEQNKGATTLEVQEATGVKRHIIHRLLREARIQITEDSKTFISCEMCGANIRSGQYCEECEAKIQKGLKIREEQREMKEIHGFSIRQNHNDEGQKRFIKNKTE